MYLYFLVIILLIGYLVYAYYKKLLQQDIIMFKGEVIEVSTFFFSHSYLKRSTNRKIWIHIPFEKNARNWINFGSRNSTDLNIPYMTLCIKSIIDNCGEHYDVFIIDDSTFCDLLGNDIDMNKLSGALKTKYRELCLLKVLHHYGGIVVPPTLYLKQSLKHIDDPTMWFVSEMGNQGNVSYKKTYPSLLLMGSNKDNTQLTNYIHHYSEIFQKDFTEESLHFTPNYFKENKVKCLDGKIIGIKDINNKPIMLEDLMENKQIVLDPKNIGLYIPHAELMKRSKYNWFCYLCAKEVLECNVFISSYMKCNTP